MRRQILNETAKLLREHSYESTTMRAIAERAGIKGASIYHHFASKDAIVVTVVNEGVEIVGAAVEAALAALPASASIREKLQAMIRAHLEASLQNSDYVSASLRTFPHLPPDIRNACRTARRHYETLWSNLVAEAQSTAAIAPQIAPASLRLLLLGAVNWAGEWYRPDRLSIDQLASDWSDLVLNEPCADRPRRLPD